MNAREFSNDDYEAVEFKQDTNSRIRLEPMYYTSGFSPMPQMFARKTVLDRLLHALEFLPEHYGFLIWDIYRPRAVQKKLFDWMREEIRVKYPTLSDEENYAESQKYMSAPAEIGDDYCPPHLSGGAIDLTLYDIAAQQELDMGTLFDDCSEKAHSNYFELKTRLSPAEIRCKEARHILRTAMTRAGFTAYHYEWWHFDIGNLFWSRATGNPAVFGPLFGDREWPTSISYL